MPRYKKIPLGFNRLAVIASASISKEKNTIHCITEADINEPRRLISCLTASFDHNIVDGAPAARFMKKFTDTIKEGNVIKDLYHNQ